MEGMLSFVSVFLSVCPSLRCFVGLSDCLSVHFLVGHLRLLAGLLATGILLLLLLLPPPTTPLFEERCNQLHGSEIPLPTKHRTNGGSQSRNDERSRPTASERRSGGRASKRTNQRTSQPTNQPSVRPSVSLSVRLRVCPSVGRASQEPTKQGASERASWLAIRLSKQASNLLLLRTVVVVVVWTLRQRSAAAEISCLCS